MYFIAIPLLPENRLGLVRGLLGREKDDAQFSIFIDYFTDHKIDAGLRTRLEYD